MKSAPVLAALALIAPLAPAAAGALPAEEVPSQFQPVFSGALVSTYEDGRQGKTWLSPDGGFTAEGRTGKRNAGKWTLDKNRVCLRQTRPFPLPFHYCTPLPASLDAPWPAKAPTGDRITIRFVAGDRP